MRIPVTTTKTQELGSFLKDFNWHCPSWNLHTADMKFRHCHLLAIGSTAQLDRHQGRLSHKERQIFLSSQNHSLLNECSLQTPLTACRRRPSPVLALSVSAPFTGPPSLQVSLWGPVGSTEPCLGRSFLPASPPWKCLTLCDAPNALLYPHST